MSDLHQRLAKKLIAFRGEKSRRQYAKEIGLSHTTLNRLEDGTQNVTLNTLAMLCEKLQCDIADLFD
jgi:DNA-binding Xre family transcriptional regulator